MAIGRPTSHKEKKSLLLKGMYNGLILASPRRIIDELEERETEKRGLSSLN